MGLAIQARRDWLFVAAAGNDNVDLSTQDLWPCSIPLENIICVAASNSSDTQAVYWNGQASNYDASVGGDVDIVAPGRDNTSTVPLGGYQAFDGTSAAAPHVAAAAAVVWGMRPTMKVADVKELLISSARNVPSLAGVAPGGRLLQIQPMTDRLFTSGFAETLYGQGPNGWRWGTYSMLAVAGQPPIVGDPTAVVVGGEIRAYSRSIGGHLIETIANGAGGQTWNGYDLTSLAGAHATAASDPEVAMVAGLPRVYATRADGHLMEFLYGTNGWEAHDLTGLAGAPASAGKPTVAIIDGLPRVYARATDGRLLEFAWSGQGGRGWVWYDLTSASAGPRLVGEPHAILKDGMPLVYARGADGHLVETVANGVGGRTWNWYDVTALTQSPPLAGDPFGVMFGTTPRVYAVTQTGDLIEAIRATTGWSYSDLSSPSGAPQLAGSRPAFLMIDGLPHVYSRSTGDHVIETLYGRGPAGWGWSSYDLTAEAGQGSVSGDLSAILHGNSPRVYHRGTFG